MRQEAVTNYEQVKAQQEQEAQAQFQEYLVEEQKALLTKLPEWANEAKAKPAINRLDNASPLKPAPISQTNSRRLIPHGNMTTPRF